MTPEERTRMAADRTRLALHAEIDAMADEDATAMAARLIWSRMNLHWTHSERLDGMSAIIERAHVIVD